MTEEQIKEQLSKHFTCVLGNMSGYKFSEPSPDNGVDLLACKVVCRMNNGKRRFMDGSNILRFQLKCTCQSSVKVCENSIKYDLKSKNYNDLVYQNSANSLSPLILILCVLPNEKENWINLEEESLKIFSEAFFYQASETSVEVSNENSTKRIEIPLSNRITSDFMDNLYQEVFL